MNNAVQFYKDQFTKENKAADFSLMDLVPCLITNEDNALLNKVPTVEEINRVVFALNGNSVSGSDGLTGLFYQVCWDIVENDVVTMVKAFFQGMTLPKSITH